MAGQWSLSSSYEPSFPQDMSRVPKVNVGTQIEIDIAAYEQDEPLAARHSADDAGGVATAAWVAEPIVRVATELPE